MEVGREGWGGCGGGGGGGVLRCHRHLGHLLIELLGPTRLHSLVEGERGRCFIESAICDGETACNVVRGERRNVFSMSLSDAFTITHALCTIIYMVARQILPSV